MLGVNTRVVRGQSLTLSDCLALSPRYVVIGPGPGNPSQAFLSKELMAACAGRLPVLGICLGHQALAEIYGGTVGRAHAPMHGKTSSIFHQGQGIFRGLPQGFAAARYHSLIVDESTLPPCLEISSRSDSGEIMGLRHRQYNVEGIQFHPESILTDCGLTLLKNFIDSD